MDLDWRCEVVALIYRTHLHAGEMGLGDEGEVGVVEKGRGVKS